MIPTERQFNLLYSDYQQLDTPERVAGIKRNRVSASGCKVRAMRIAPMRDYQYAALAMCGE